MLSFLPAVPRIAGIVALAVRSAQIVLVVVISANVGTSGAGKLSGADSLPVGYRVAVGV